MAFSSPQPPGHPGAHHHHQHQHQNHQHHHHHHDTPPPDNPTLFQAFEWYLPADAAHWGRLEAALPALQHLGVSRLWLPPACKAGWYTGNGYDIYDLYDLGEFAQKGAVHTKWGTKHELVRLADAARRRGLGVLFDAVLNHRAAADAAQEVVATRVDSKDRTTPVEEPRVIEAWCKYEFPGRGDAYSPLKWEKRHFNGIDYDHRTKTNGVWKFEGKDWAGDVDEELGNYDYLMFANVDHSHPEVRHDLFHWIQWLASQVPLSGLRLDAIKHYSASFLKDFVRHIDATVGRDWFLVGEYWREDSEVLAKYIEYMDHRLSLFDVRLVSNFSRLSMCPNADLRSVFDGTLVGRKPANAVTFVTNHDTMEGQSLETPVAPFFAPLAYALILLRATPSLPCVFYGDLYGYTKPHGPGFIQPLPYLPILLLARKLYAYGPQTDYFHDEPHCIGWTRAGHPGGSLAPNESSKGAGLAVIMTNARRWVAKWMFVGERHAGERWTDVLRGCWGETVVDAHGWAEFRAGPRSVAVWVAQDAPRRDEIDLCDFDCDIYGQGFRRQKAATADDLYRPRLPTQPAWMNGNDR